MMKRIFGMFAPALVAGFLLAGLGTGALAQSCSGTPNANTICAGPSSGGAGFPSFRPMVTGDIPAGTVTNAGLANMAAGTTKCNSAATSGPPQDCNYPIINVKDPQYGAKCDGVTNDFTAISNAITAASGGHLIFPPGTCVIVLPSATGLGSPGAGTVIEGAGKNATTLSITPTGTTAVTALTMTGANAVVKNLAVQINGDNTGLQGPTIFDLRANGLKFQNLSLNSNAVEGFLIGGTATNGDTIRLTFSCSCLTGTPITVTAPITTGETTSAMATALAAAVNANSTITGQGISASAAGSFVSISQPDGLLPQASYTYSTTGAGTETGTHGASVFSNAWLINAGPNVTDFLAENVDVSGFNYSFLRPIASTATAQRLTFRGGFYNRILTGAVNYDSPDGFSERLIVEGLHIGSVATSDPLNNNLPIALAHTVNSVIVGNTLEGTYNANAIHFEEGSSGLVISGNVIQQATSTGLGAGYNGTCILGLDNNVGGAGFRTDNDIVIIGNACFNSVATNISGYGLFNSVMSLVGNNWTVVGNVFGGYGGGINAGLSTFTIADNTILAYTAAGTGITLPASSSSGVIQGNRIAAYPTAVANSGTGNTGLDLPSQTYTPSPSCGTATFTNNSSKFKTTGKETWAQLDITISALGTCTNVLTFTLPNTSNTTGVLPGIATGSVIVSCNLSAASNSATCVKSAGANFAASDNLKVSGVYENQ